MTTEWGWNPSTFEAIGTVGASIVAAVALVVSLAQMRARRIDLLGRHARAVYVTTTRTPSRPEDWHGFELVIANRGTAAIKVRCMIVKVAARTYDSDKIYSDPHNMFKNVGAMSMSGALYWIPAEYRFFRTSWPGTVEPGTATTLDVETAISVRPKPVRVKGRRGVSAYGGGVGITFADPDGIEWTRRADGRLIRGRGLTPQDVRRLGREANSGFV